MMNNQFGMPMMGMNMGMPNMMGMNMGMPNMMGMNMGMPNMTGGMNNNIFNNEDWKKGFQLAMDEVSPTTVVEEDDIPGPKMNVVFTTTIGTKRNLVLSENTPVNKALQKYLKTVGHSELYDQSEKIGFLYNARKLEFKDTTPIKDFFNGSVNPKIIVNDINNLIGA